jgi:hypothetical protein
MLSHRRFERIEPMRRAEEIFQRLAWLDIFDSQRNDRNALIDRPLDLALDLRRCIRILGEEALTIDLAQPMPGTMSRGAIQQRRPRPSSAVQTASPAAMSLLE